MGWRDHRGGAAVRRKFRWVCRPLSRSPDNRPMFALGARIGYWPCLFAPFIQVTFWRWHFEAWHGLPSKEQIARDDP